VLPSPTVENYLKAIYLGSGQITAPNGLLPMGQLATSLGVAPGTATTMVKTLSESGLVRYEPYAGVALTPAGERLAALVLRRHRLIELFLVRVMGYSWDEVHDEAEHLEHVVTDRLIDRIDEMLGRPEADPHGDPIPNAEGLVKAQETQSLLTCPLRTPVTVTRVIDQDRSFLRFIEGHHLKPGESIEVEERDAAADSVRVRGKGDQRITIGTRAASKLMVQVARIAGVLIVLATMAYAQAPAAKPEPFAITDNSTLVEEAFNQEAGVVQNVVNVHATRDGSWETTFTQEWPVFVHRHQLSYTLGIGRADGTSGFGDSAVHYRFQVTDEGDRVPAFSPRVSLLLPTGSNAKGLGAGSAGWEVNLPFSKQVRDVYFHWNGGFTHSPAEKVEGRAWNLFTPRWAGAAMWRAWPMFHLLLESQVEWRETVEAATAGRQRAVTVSPGFRGGWNSGDKQTVIAFTVPIERTSGETTAGIVAYLSYELPFRK
jgi:DtxR family transcriptional regulator, Mn-dependent transcriptional regulator